MKKFLTAISMFIILAGSVTLNAQFKNYGWKIGGQINALIPANDFRLEHGLELGLMGRALVRFELNCDFDLEAGVGYGKLRGKDNIEDSYSANLIPFDLRLLYSPFDEKGWNPYFYAGLGLLSYSADEKTTLPSPNAREEDGVTGFIPLGLGAEFKLSDEWLLDATAGFAYSFADDMNYYAKGDLNDGYYNIGLGIIFCPNGPNADNDNDGLTNGEENELGTDPDVADTDGDGLSDGAEFKEYKTDPMKADSDNDGLNDYDEIKKYSTNPNMMDTDNDGLNDHDELMKHKTDPLQPDTDGDGLKDGEEVNNYKTSPFKTDTDMDGLNDGEEITKYTTDPLNADTDGGTVQDGQEVKNGTDPKDGSDDIPKKEIVFEIENIQFDINKCKIRSDAATILDELVSLLKENEELTVKITGHTCNLGTKAYNMKLSEKRAKAAQQYLVDKGIDASRTTLEWFGEDKPAVPNTSKANREKNRRVEFERTDNK